jgi:membrane-bound metal-dependent hydrolase YbcI (DUF457 family)
MFIGHFGLAFAAKRVAPRTSLGVLFAAAQFLDLLWPIFLIVGLEQVAPGDRYFTSLRFVHYPWSHSLAMTLVWSGLAALAYAAIRHDRRGALVVGLLVSSHWVLDYVTHRPDLPLYPGGTVRLGLGLWNSVAATLVVEGLIFTVGVALYVKNTRPRDRVGRYAFWGLVLFLVAAYAASIPGPPPPNMTVVAWMALSLWLIALWGWWVDRHRTAARNRAQPLSPPS